MPGYSQPPNDEKLPYPPGDFKPEELHATTEEATAPPPDDLPSYDQYMGQF